MLGSTAKIVVRRAKPSDAKELAAIFRESWLLAYRGIIPHLHLETMVRRRVLDRYYRDLANIGICRGYMEDYQSKR